MSLIHPNFLVTIVVRVPDYFVDESVGYAGAKQKIIEDFSGRFRCDHEVLGIDVVEE